MKNLKKIASLVLILLVVFLNKPSSSIGATIFSDGFEATPNGYVNWTSGNPESGNWTVDSSGHTGKAARVKGDNDSSKTLYKNVSTAGQQDIVLSYWFKSSDLSGGDNVTVDWYNGSSWQTLFTIDNVSDESDWTHKTHNLPAGANNLSTFKIRFKADMHSGSRKVWLDDVSLSGTPTPTKGNLIVNKIVTNNNGGDSTASAFAFKVNGGSAVLFEVDGSNSIEVDPGIYSVVEDGTPIAGYTTSYEGCSDINIVAGETKTCTITNDDNPDFCPNVNGYQIIGPCADQICLDDGGNWNVEQQSCVIQEPAQCDPQVNLIQNGGFEAPALSPNSWSIIPDTDSLLKWLVAWVAPQVNGTLGLEIQNNVAGAPAEGSQHAELDGDHPVSIWQDVPTIPGKVYNLDFRYSARPTRDANDNKIQVKVDGVALGAELADDGTSLSNTSWNLHSRSFVATGATTKVEFMDTGTDTSYGGYLDDVSLRCDPNPKATVSAKKVVCDSEADLPNWGNGGADITATTADDYVAAHPSCHLEPWTFEWAPDGTGNPGDNVGVAGGVWTPFTTTAQIPAGSLTWVREQMKPGYVPFSGALSDLDSTVSKNSAELYCNTDVLNYDNYDWINPVLPLQTYYCVGFNAPTPTPTQPQQCDFVSDTTNITQTNSNAVETWTHSAWANSTLLGSLAKWIWNAYHVVNPTSDETETFTKNFNVTGTINSAMLSIAADNGYKVEINGVTVVDKLTIEHNYEAISGPTDVASYLIQGANNIKITVKNFGVGDSTDETNPAGLLYKLSISADSCSEIIPPPEPQLSTVTMCKTDDSEQPQPLSGWTLMLKGDSVQSDLSVPSTLSSGVNSDPLVAGVSYIAEAVGTWFNQGGANPVDAEYSTTDGWATHMDGYTGYQTDILELQIDSKFDPLSNWGAYNSLLHKYAQSFVPTGSSSNFRIFDGTGITQNESWFGDNEGSLSVDIFKGYAGITGGNGCVTFTNVPYGTYTKDEIMQDGWENVSGLGEVTVSHPTETFTIVNHDTSIQTDGKVHIFKFINGEQATPENADSVAFPMNTATYGNAPFFLRPSGWTEGDAPYEATTSTITAGGTYTANENLTTSPALVGESCDSQYHPAYELIGYSTGSRLDEAKTATVYPDAPTVTVNGDKFIIVWNHRCGQVEGAHTLKVHIYKYLKGGNTETQIPNESDIPAFPMTATWQTANLNEGASTSGQYVLGNYHGGAELQFAADTSPMNSPANYTTSEITDGGVVVPANSESCPAGKYRLVGYRYGDSIENAEEANLSTDAPVFTAITDDQYVIVVNEKCPDDLPPPPSPIDVCPNLPDNQASVPQGYFLNESNQCVPNGGGGGHALLLSNNGGNNGGQVLGASTECGLFLGDWLKMGKKNNQSEVKKLQTFLNDYLKLNPLLKVDGHFGLQTWKAVVKFQEQESILVLHPWGLKKGTGWVFKTTVTRINNIMCPDLNLQIPPLTI